MNETTFMKLYLIFHTYIVWLVDLYILFAVKVLTVMSVIVLGLYLNGSTGSDTHTR